MLLCSCFPSCGAKAGSRCHELSAPQPTHVIHVHPTFVSPVPPLNTRELSNVYIHKPGYVLVTNQPRSARQHPDSAVKFSLSSTLPFDLVNFRTGGARPAPRCARQQNSKVHSFGCKSVVTLDLLDIFRGVRRCLLHRAALMEAASPPVLEGPAGPGHRYPPYPTTSPQLFLLKPCFPTAGARHHV